MPTDKKVMDNSLGNVAKNEHKRESLLRAIRMEIETLAPNELERLYAVIALMEKKKNG